MITKASTKLILFATSVVLAAVWSPTGAQQQHTQASNVLISNLKDQSSVGGCGCSFNFPNERNRSGVPGSGVPVAYWSGIEESDPDAVMNIDGEDVKLRLVKSFEPKKERLGSRSTESYEATGIKVSVVYVTTRMCGPNEEGCEATNYDATFTVIKGERKQAIRLKGSCGC